MNNGHSSEIIIRKYVLSDREAIRKISYETSFLERPGEFCDDVELTADVLTLYFTDYEPESCFVATENNRVIGYLIGSKDSARMKRINYFKIYPLILIELIGRGTVFHKKTFQFIFHVIKSCLKGEFRTPVAATLYPAVLHINIQKEYRNRGIGQKLIARYVDYLREYKLSGIQASVMSEKAKNFFIAAGFQVLSASLKTYMVYRYGVATQTYMLGKKLEYPNLGPL